MNYLFENPDKTIARIKNDTDDRYDDVEEVTPLQSFQSYVLSFYNDVDGIYPIANKETILKAIDTYMASKPLHEIEYDSIDRENVRSIIEPYNPLQ